MTPQEYEKKISVLLDDLTSLESYIHDLFNFTPLPLCFISSNGVILEVNPAFVKLTGYSQEELIGESINKIFETEKIDKIKNETLKKGGVSGEEIILFAKNKKEIPVSISSQTRKSEGEIIGFFLALFDLTEIKRNEEEKIVALIRQKALALDAQKKANALEQKTIELQQKIAELEKFHQIAIGRELKMIELKKEIKKLKKELQK